MKPCMTISFNECEHEGDLSNYLDDVVGSGGTVCSSEINADAETGEVFVEFDNKEDFIKRFCATESSWFSSLSYRSTYQEK